MVGVAACVASAGVPARCGGPWARLGAWAPSLVCGGFARKSFFRKKRVLAGARRRFDPPVDESTSGVALLRREHEELRDRAAMRDLAQHLARLIEGPEGGGRWADGCRSVFLDIGSNRAVSVRKLFEEPLYPEHEFDWDSLSLPHKRGQPPPDHLPITRLFAKTFGSFATRQRIGFRGLCAFAFEPNVRHAARLREIEACYRAKGWRVHIFTETAVSDYDGTARMDPGLVGTNEEWSANIVGHRHPKFNTKEENFTKVATIDLAAWVLRHVAGRRIPSEPSELPVGVYAKVDIERSEYHVLPRMLMISALCTNVINTISIEWHTPERNEHRQVYEVFRSHLSALTTLDPRHCNATRILDRQDDSYLHDTHLAAQSVCRGRELPNEHPLPPVRRP